MARKTPRKFYYYTLQAHGHAGTYDEIFAALRRVERSDRLATVDHQRIFLSDVTQVAGGYMVRVVGIRPETDYTTFDELDFSISDSSLPEHKRFAIAAHGYLFSGSRRFLYEYVRGGPKADEAIKAIELVLRGNNPAFRRLRLTATPVVAETFLADVNRLERIRVVRIDVAEPNASWTDWDDPLHELGQESGADHVSLQATAPRAESLSKRAGIVQVLKQALRAPNSHLEKAVVEGRFPNESSDRMIRTDKHHSFEARKVNVDSGGSTSVISAAAVFTNIVEAEQDADD